MYVNAEWVTNMPFFPWQRTQHMNVWTMVGRNMPTLTRLWLTVCVRYNVETKSGPRLVPREHAEYFLSIINHMNAEQWYHKWKQLTLFCHTIVRRGPSSLFRQLHVTRFLCRREKDMGMYRYTKWTCSQSLMVVERTISDLEAKKHLFSIHVIQ